MKNIQVKLLYNTKLSVMVQAGRTCWESHDKGGCYITPTDNIDKADVDFLDRVINKNKHGSVSEHVVYNFAIDGISRAANQELARHRMASLSVKSTRYTLKKDLAKEETFFKANTNELDSINGVYGYLNHSDLDRASKYISLTGFSDVDYRSVHALEELRKTIQSDSGYTLDVIKYNLPECYRTKLVWTINARSLRNFLELRTSPHALKEMRVLAHKVYEAIPEAHKFIFEDVVQPLV